MSDSRFNLKVKFEWEASLNWCADCGEIDRRIAEWFNAEADREKKEELKYPDA
jgi:hypothetical protein